MIGLRDDILEFRFPEIHQDALVCLDFQRTLRIPDDNRPHCLPPGLGRFPLRHVDDFASRIPETWPKHGGVMLPMFQSEALWIYFGVMGRLSPRPTGFPCAIKVAAGKINAVTGDAWSNDLHTHPQDYVVTPSQPWLDGFCVAKGLIRQFVAMSLGHGYTAEEQLTSATEHGGLQIIVYPMKRERYLQLLEKRKREAAETEYLDIPAFLRRDRSAVEEMGLAPGGLMRQEIYEDMFGPDAWDTSKGHRCFVHILNSVQWRWVTHEKPPGKPPTARDYTKANLPWFSYYNDVIAALPGAEKLAKLDSVATKAIKLGRQPLPDNDPVSPNKLVIFGSRSEVNEGEW